MPEMYRTALEAAMAFVLCCLRYAGIICVYRFSAS